MTSTAATKQWLTPKRIARGPEAANEELRRWSSTAFRPAKMYGDVRAMRADVLASRTARVGSSHIARLPKRRWLSTAETTVIGVAAVGVGYLIGRWWRRRHPSRVIGEDSLLVGTDVLGAC